MVILEIINDCEQIGDALIYCPSEFRKSEATSKLKFGARVKRLSVVYDAGLPEVTCDPISRLKAIIG